MYILDHIAMVTHLLVHGSTILHHDHIHSLDDLWTRMVGVGLVVHFPWLV